MNRIVALLAFVVLGLTGIQQAKATHIMGMNISYEHLVADTYVVTLDFWRYCGGSAFNGTPTSASTGVTYNYSWKCPDAETSESRTAQLDTVIDVSPICAPMAPFMNSCIAGWQTGLLGIEWNIMRDTVALSELNVTSTCSEFMLEYYSGNRNTGVNYSGQPWLTAYTTLRQTVYPNNDSPEFTTQKPIPFFCDGQEVTYNWGIVEQNGDSLYWELDSAINNHSWVSGFSYITYNAPWYGLEPMTGVQIDSLTGELTFTAYKPPTSIAANYAIAVKVTEYKQTGEYVSTTQRDVQFIVIDSCANNAPERDSMGIVMDTNSAGEQTGPNNIEVCVGQDFGFYLPIYDFDTSGNYSGDSLTISCNIDQVLPGATWYTVGGNPDTIFIQWTAVPVPQSQVPFNITVEDDFCPVTGFNIYNYVIDIIPSTFLGPDTAICVLDTIRLDANGGDTFSWSVLSGDPIIVGQNFGCVQCRDPWIHPSQTTTYVVTSNLSATCGNTDTITIEVFNQFDVGLTPTNGGTVDTVVYCATDGLDTITAVTPGGTYLGPGIVNTTNGTFAPDIVDPGFGKDSTILVQYILEGVCANTSTLPIRVKGLPDARIATKGPFCKFTNSVQLEGVESGGTWQGDNTTSGGVFSPSAYQNSAPTSVMIYHTIDDSGCVNTDSSEFRVINEYNSNIDSLPKICAGEEVNIHLNDYEADPFGEWSGKNVEEDANDPGEYYFNTAGLKAGSYTITYTIDGECGTQSSKDLVISVLPDASIFGADSVYCDNIMDSVLLETAREDGIWGGSLVELHDGYFVPNRVGEGLYTISYELYDTNTTCYNKEIVDVRIARTPVPPHIEGGGTYCEGDIWEVKGDGLLSNTFKWYLWDSVTSSPDSIPTLEELQLIGAGNPFVVGELVEIPSTTIYGTQVSEYGCESTWNRLTVTVLPGPKALFLVDSTQSDVERSRDGTWVGNAPLDVTFLNVSLPDPNALVYKWTFAEYEERFVDTPEPQEFTFPDIGTYSVQLFADNGRCTDSTQILIRVDRETSFFIPNVFTPNGDGNNDLFVWDIDGIDEFELMIYNRWGEKVFEATSVTDYWDGTNNNAGNFECPEGTYYYVMRGKDQTLDRNDREWRGDLTLIRQ